jgi:hypothetical protein
MVENNKPLKSYKAGALTLSVWENENGMKSVTFNRAYKDKDDNWQRTQSLRLDDLVKLRFLLDEVYRDLVISEV